MTWKGWEDFVPSSRAGIGPSTRKTPMISAARAENINDSARAPQASSTPPKRSKYGAEPTEVDGIRFDSKREAARYRDLSLRMKAGDIRRLRCQPRYALCPLIIDGADVRNINVGTSSGRRSPVAEYIADFEYEESDRGYGGITWALIVEDVKGKRTDVYSLKRRWFEAQYGKAIREI